jgi:hypothetical protein
LGGRSCLGDTQISCVYDPAFALTTKEVAIETGRTDTFTAEQIGWRFALGALIILGSYAAWPMIPVVMTADLPPSAKAALSGLFGATPFLCKLIAVALMGRPAYYFLKRTVYERFRRQWARGHAE